MERQVHGRVSPVGTMKVTRAGLAMVTFLSWVVNARTSSFIGRTLVRIRNGLTLRSSVGSNSMLSPAPFLVRSKWRKVFFAFWLLLIPLVCARLGVSKMSPAGHALRAEVGGGIIFVTPGEIAGQHKKLPVEIMVGTIGFKLKMLALVRWPSLHSCDACMVYWVQGASRKNCRQKQGETSFFSKRVFRFGRNSLVRFMGLFLCLCG